MRLIIACIVLLLFSTQSAQAQCSDPAGVTADMIFNSTYNVPTYCDGTNWIGMAGGDPSVGGPYIPNAVNFDGATDLRLASNLAGVSDGKTMALSLWFKTTYMGTANDIFYDPHVTMYTNSGILKFQAENATSTTILNATLSTAISDDKWHHIAVSIDLSNASLRHAYLDGAPVGTYTTYTDDVIAINTGAFAVGSNTSGTTDFSGDMADLWIDFNTYLDFSDPSVLAKFRDTSGNPVDLGPTGALPTGTAPDVFMSSDTASWHTNKGTGGGYTESGALTTATSTPYQPITQIVPSGLVGHWRLDETSGTTAFDSSGNGFDGAYGGSLSLATASKQGMVGRAVEFTAQYGNNYSVDGPTNATLAMTGDLSLSAWVYLDALNNARGIIAYSPDSEDGTANTNILYALYINNSFLGLTQKYGTNQSSLNYSVNAGLQPRKWYHVAAVRNATTKKITLYVDGQSIGTSSAYTNDPSGGASAKFMIGRYLNLGFGGMIDDARIYDRVLTAAEITEIYEARDGIRYNNSQRTMEYFDQNQFVAMTPPFPDVTNGLVAHWKLDETSGTTAVDSINGIALSVQNMTIAGSTAPGAVGKSLSFDGVDDYLYYTGAAAAPTHYLFDGGGSVSFWLNSQDDNNSPVLMIGAGWDLRQRDGATGETGLWFTKDFSGSLATWRSTDTTPDIAVDQWNHVVLVYDDTNVANDPVLYVNGTLASSLGEITAPLGTSSANNATQIAIGASATGAAPVMASFDDVRLYNRSLTISDIQKLYQMGTPAGSVTALPQGCATVGQVCDDGTVYAWDSSDGNVEMFTTPSDAPTLLPFNNGNTTGYVDTTATSTTDGDGNTLILAATDSDSVTSGFQPHQAALYCANLSAHGADDWYLPATNEIGVMCANKLSIGDFNLLPGYLEGTYKSSQDTLGNSAHVRFFTGCTPGSGNSKSASHRVRCVRKGPAPRCANPYGVEGSIIYNTTYDVVQYCDGARWIAIGKTSP